MGEKRATGRGPSSVGPGPRAATDGSLDRRIAVRRFAMRRNSMPGSRASAGLARPDGRPWTGARIVAWLAAGFAVMLLAGCLPATVTPQRMVTPLPFRDAYAAAVATIDTQPYPSNMGGWIITQADPSNGFVSAEMTYRTCGYVPFRFADFRCQTHVARVSVTLVERSDGTVLVAIGASDEDQARDLADALAARLRLRPVRTGP